MQIERALIEIMSEDFIAEDIEAFELPYPGAVKEIEETYFDSMLADSKNGYILDKETIYPVIISIFIADAAINGNTYFDENNSDSDGLLSVHFYLAYQTFKKDMNRKSIFSKKLKNDMEKFRLKAVECIERISDAKDCIEDKNYKILNEALISAKNNMLIKRS